MKKIAYLSLCFASVLMANTAIAGPIYLSGSVEPWETQSIKTNLDTAFGAGNWDRATFGDANLFDDIKDFVYIDGGGNTSGALFAWLETERANLENFVINGGSVFLNAATWGESVSVFGSTIKYQTDNNNNQNDSCFLTDNSFGKVGTFFTGSYCNHGQLELSENGWKVLMNNTDGAILAERSFGKGWLTLGNLTASQFWDAGNSGLDTNQFRADLLLRAQNLNGQVPQVSEPASVAFLSLGLMGFAWMRRKSKA